MATLPQRIVGILDRQLGKLATGLSTERLVEQRQLPVEDCLGAKIPGNMVRYVKEDEFLLRETVQSCPQLQITGQIESAASIHLEQAPDLGLALGCRHLPEIDLSDFNRPLFGDQW